MTCDITEIKDVSTSVDYRGVRAISPIHASEHMCWCFGMEEGSYTASIGRDKNSTVNYIA